VLFADDHRIMRQALIKPIKGQPAIQAESKRQMVERRLTPVFAANVHANKLIIGKVVGVCSQGPMHCDACLKKENAASFFSASLHHHLGVYRATH
jgi:hypothetical protein